MRSGGDIANLLRQGKMPLLDILLSDPRPSKAGGKVFGRQRELPRIFKEAGKSTISETDFQALNQRLLDDPAIKAGIDNFGLDIPGLPGHLKEEAFHAGAVEKIPVLGKLYVRPSERLHTALNNGLRAAMFRKWFDYLRRKGLDPESKDTAIIEKFKAIARAVNLAGQRGQFKRWGPVIQDAAAIIWAPRAKISRYQLLSDISGMSSAPSIAKNIARANLAKVALFNSWLALLLFSIYGDEFEWIRDPERSDFLNFRIGKNTVVDPWFGIGPVIRAGVRAYLGKVKSPYTGKTRKVTVPEIVGGEMTSGIAPGPTLTYNMLEGQDWRGYEKDKLEALMESMTPLGWWEIGQIVNEHGMKGLPLAGLALGAEGVSIFDYEKARREQERLKRERGIPVRKKSKGKKVKHAY